MSFNKVKSCNQTGCPVGISGTCLESLEFEECPHFYWEDAISSEDDELTDDLVDVAPQLLETNFFSLSTGDVLTIDEAIKITYKYKPAIIMILGDGESGKTTLSATLHELFQRGPFSDYWFAGSITPIAFEKRCHFSRLQSGLEDPSTEKTKSGDFNLLHLAVKHKDELDKPAKHILLSDISGELFKLASNSSDYIKSLSVIKSADRVLITLDGKKLASGKTKNAVITNAKTFIKKALEEGLFNKLTSVDFIITKWDELLLSHHFSLDIDIIDPMSKLLINEIHEINFIKIAARPSKPTEGIELGYGMNRLLHMWLASLSEISSDADAILNYPRYGEAVSSRQFVKVLSYGIQSH